MLVPFVEKVKERDSGVIHSRDIHFEGVLKAFGRRLPKNILQVFDIWSCGWQLDLGSKDPRVVDKKVDIARLRTDGWDNGE